MLEAQTRSPVDSKVDAVFTACLDDEQILEYLKGNYEVNREFNPAYTLNALGRSTRIVGRMLEEVARNAQSDQLRNSAGAGAAAWIARLGAVFWSLVQLAVPGGLGNNLFRHWVKILYAFELLLLAGSTLALSQETQQFAVTALILTAGTHLLATVLGDMMRTRHWAFRVPLFVLMLVLLGLAGIGAWTLRERIVPELNCGITKRLPWASQYDIARSCEALTTALR
jgi:hypothetical protein